ncbi:MAG: aldo/keto reductase [Anaerolineae bacterium]|nr:aldo/keto reductase [Anaerolineae bacterium]
MEYVQLGQTNVVVSRLGFGGAPAGLTNYLGEYSPANAEQRRRVIDAIQRALERGITYFDTAPGYGQGEGESIFGEALQGVEDVVVATKIGGWNTDVRASVEASLGRLRRDQIDLVQLHGSSYSEELANIILETGGMLEQMLRLKKEGLVRFVGFTSEDNNPAVYRFIQSGQFDVMQVCYNLLFQHPAEFTRPFGSMFEAQKQGMGVVTMRTMTSGLFQKWVQRVNPANQFNYAPALLQFVLSNPLVHVALVGMRAVGEVEENVRICEDLAGRLDMDWMHEKYV